jgi:hypothetical protein
VASLDTLCDFCCHSISLVACILYTGVLKDEPCDIGFASSLRGTGKFVKIGKSYSF